MTVPEELSNDFIIFEDGTTDKMLIFMTPYARETILRCKYFFCDGIFKQIPAPFKHLYSIHADIGSTSTETNVVPLVFCLLPNTKEETYVRAFNLLKILIINPE